MSTNRSQPVVANQDFGNAQRIENLPNAVEPQHPLTLAQAQELLELKQDNLTGGSCIEIDGTTINFLIGSTGTDHSELILSGSGFGSLDGTYALMDYNGDLQQVSNAQNFDLIIGGNDSIYSKQVSGSTWAVIGKRASYWWAALTSVDPSSVTQDVEGFIVNYLSVDNFLITQGSEQEVGGSNVPSSSSEYVEYAVGGNPGGIIVQNGKAVLDFASSIANASSSNVFSASMVKQYLDERDDFFKLAHNQVFSNAVANLAGNPSNPQAAIEALKALADSISIDVSANQTTATNEYLNIDLLQQALGSTSQHMGTTHDSLSNNTTVKSLLNELAVLVAALRADTVATFGIDAGTQVTPTGDNVSVGVTLMEAINQLDEAIGAIQGDLTSRLPAVDHYHSGLQYPLTADQLAGTESFDEVKYDVLDPETGEVLMHWATDLSSCSIPKTILVDYGVAGHVGAGVYVRDPATGFLSRVTWLDEDAEIQRNAVMQIRYGGSIAGAEFAITSPDETIVGSEPIGFTNIRAVIVGQKTIDTTKLADELNEEIDLKTDKYVCEVTTDATGYVTVAHNLASADFIAQVWTTTGVVEVVSAEISNPSATEVVIGAVPNTTYKVVLIG